MLKLTEKDYEFIRATYRSFGVTQGQNADASWRVVGQELERDGEYVCVIGAFDGFHKGHRTLIQKARNLADSNAQKLVVCMFDPDPAVYFQPELPNEELLVADERIALLLDAGADSCLCFSFNEHLAKLDYKDFLHMLQAMFNLKKLCVGYDFKLGAQGKGTFDKICDFGAQEGFEVVGVELLMQDLTESIKISSTTIRRALVEGDVEGAHGLLGHMSVIDGVVVHGRGEGTTFGFPTANISCSTRRVAPKSGVYAAWVSNGKTIWPSALHVGLPPTFNEGDAQVESWLLEAFLLDCNENLYGQDLRVFIVQKIGESQKFSSLNALESALRGYIEATETLLGQKAATLRF